MALLSDEPRTPQPSPVRPGDRGHGAHDRRRRRTGDGKWVLVLLGPFLIGLAIFYLYPIVSTFWYSFTHWGYFGGHTWTGLSNYQQVVTSPEIRRSLLNTLIYTAISLLAVPISLVLATMMNVPGLGGRTAYRVIYFLPVVTMPVAIGMMWKLLLNGDYGLVNAGLRLVGVHGPAWLQNSQTALLAVSFVGIWSVLGYNLILISAGLQTIPAQLYEAAALDGATSIRAFIHVTVPMISPTLFFVTVISVINALQMFDLIYIMVGETSPAIQQSETIIYLFYKVGFRENDKGLASALAFCLLIIIVALTAIQFRLQRRWVTYD